MNKEKHFILKPVTTALVLLSLCLLLSSCGNPNVNSDRSQANYPFSGNWQGNGVDSEGNEFTFAAKVNCLGDNKYRVLILDKLDTLKKPMHIMDGVLKNNKFAYTADEGLYVGGGELNNDMFEGYYKGPVDGTYKMWRVK
jgi:hypothetical protein